MNVRRLSRTCGACERVYPLTSVWCDECGQLLIVTKVGLAGPRPVAAEDRAGQPSRRFVLDEEKWEEFVELLDRPVRENVGLARLFSRPTLGPGVRLVNGELRYSAAWLDSPPQEAA